jgi:hypothetical protein
MFLNKLLPLTTRIKFHVFTNQPTNFKKMNSNPLHFVSAYLSFMDDNVISGFFNSMFLSVFF